MASQNRWLYKLGGLRNQDTRGRLTYRLTDAEENRHTDGARDELVVVVRVVQQQELRREESRRFLRLRRSMRARATLYLNIKTKVFSNFNEAFTQKNVGKHEILCVQFA